MTAIILDILVGEQELAWHQGIGMDLLSIAIVSTFIRFQYQMKLHQRQLNTAKYFIITLIFIRFDIL